MQRTRHPMRPSLIKRLRTAALLLALAVHPAVFAATNSLSDFSTEEFGGASKEAPEARNPFSPPTPQANLDPSSLKLEGILIGNNNKIALVSGQILKTGHTLGHFIIKDIVPGSVVVQSELGVTRLKLDGYLASPDNNPSNYDIAFRGAELKNALTMIASAGNFNILIPDKTSGSVSLVFHNIALKEALGSILSVNQLVFAEENGIIRVGNSADFVGGSHLPSRNLQLRYATAKNLVDSVKALLTKEGSVTADVRTNMLAVKDTESVLANVEALVKRLDIQDIQVRIEAKIVDVTRSFTRALGIQWGFVRDATSGRISGFGSPGAGELPTSGEPINVNLPASPTGGATSGFGMILSNITQDIDLEAHLTAGEEKGDVHIISHPTITTVNNTPASIRSGLIIYVRQTSLAGGTATNELREINTGIELRVTPQISSDNAIKLNIEAEESQADFTRTVDGVPSVIDNSASTTVLVQNGETTVIGGMMRITKTNAKGGVPFLSAIPILGWLVKNDLKEKTDNELLIFITPYLLKDSQVSKEAPLISQVDTRESVYVDVKDPVVPPKKVPAPRKAAPANKHQK